MKNFTRFLLSLAGTVLCLGMASAQTSSPGTVTITDDLAPHAAITRFESFSTTLSARVQNPPRATTEIEVTGPTYHWSGGNSGVPLSSSTGQNVGVTGVLEPASNHQLRGANSLTISCYATYSFRNLRDPNIRIPSVSTPATSKEVSFFVRVPDEIKEISFTQVIPGVGTAPLRGVVSGNFKYWGDFKKYTLRVMDNQPVAHAYGFGQAVEQFGTVEPGPGDPNFSPNPTSVTFFDMLGEGFFKDDIQSLLEYPINQAPATDPADVLMGTAQQKWGVTESDQLLMPIDIHLLIYRLYDVSRYGG